MQKYYFILFFLTKIFLCLIFPVFSEIQKTKLFCILKKESTNNVVLSNISKNSNDIKKHKKFFIKRVTGNFFVFTNDDFLILRKNFSNFEKNSLTYQDIKLILYFYNKIKLLKTISKICWTQHENNIIRRIVLIFRLDKFECNGNLSIKNKFLNEDISYYILFFKNISNMDNFNIKFEFSTNEIELQNIFMRLWNADLSSLVYDDKFSIFSEISLDNIQGLRLSSIRNSEKFYTFKGKNEYYCHVNSIEKIFLKYPTKNSFLISSNFNLRRFNPITKKLSPHYGVDFSMPIGTPVLSTGNGKVTISRYGKNAGNFISISHYGKYTTKYMHLLKSFVKIGQNVKKGEIIALSGNSGRTTGPHLHYEFWIGKKAINPLYSFLHQ
ncbi:hypothetical protein AOQ88_02365 [Candidatus Riesia sp. GBBU]|nr:hypothetical protein AOQ88_02085 [Candidatus Riesia sp. GBBU]ARC55064.1 hypothetical protein AOQ88_02365 [Candidatus Riesia sp. GBBU]